MNLQKFENFFTEELYNELINTARYLMQNGDYVFSTNARWNPGIVKDSFPIFMHGLNRESQLFSDCVRQIENKTKMIISDYQIMLYYWTRFSYIPWHTDENHDGALTVYLNEEWQDDWGGYFLYKENKEIKAIVPKPNFALLQQGGLHHATTPVNLSGGIRITLQTFLRKK
jgi:hypothetical protein